MSKVNIPRGPKIKHVIENVNLLYFCQFGYKK